MKCARWRYPTDRVHGKRGKSLSEPRYRSGTPVLGGSTLPDPVHAVSDFSDEAAQRLRGHAKLTSQSSRPGNTGDGKQLQKFVSGSHFGTI
jgi:hypothetical protein